MINAKCPSCQSTVSGPERLSGKKVQCGKCKTVFEFPQAPAAAAPAAEPQPTPQPTPRPTEPQATPQPAESQVESPVASPAAPAATSTPSAPKVSPEARTPNSNKIIMLGAIGAIVIALVLVAIFVLPKMFGGGSPTQTIRQYATSDTFAAGTIDLQSIIKSDLYEKLGLAALVKEAIKEVPTKLKPEDFASVTILMDKPKTAGSPPDDPTLVIRLVKDMPLKDMVDPKLAAAIKDHKGIEYVELGPVGVLAKTEPSTVCMLTKGGVAALKELVEKLNSGSGAKLDDVLTTSMERVSDQSSFFAVHVPDSMKGKLPGPMAAMASVKNAGFGFTVGSDVELKLAVTFAKEEDASNASLGFVMIQGMGAGTMQGKASAAKDADVKAVFTAVAKAITGIKTKQEGSEILAELKIPGQDIVLVKENYAKALPVLMGSGDPATGGEPSGNPLEALMGLFGK